MMMRRFHTQRTLLNTFDRNFQVRTRRKAWEGQDKDTFFREKYAHVHARQKKQREEAAANSSGDKNQFDRFFGDKYSSRRDQDDRGYSPRRDQDDRGYSPRRDQDDRDTPRNGLRRQDRDRDEKRGYRRNDYMPAQSPRARSLMGLETRRGTPRLKPEPWKELIYGTSAVKAALKGKKRTISTLYMMDEERWEGLAREHKVKLEKRTREELNNMTNNAVHNGVVAETRLLDVPDIESVEAEGSQVIVNVLDMGHKTTQERYSVKANKPNPFGVYIDQVTDTHNMGAIIRSAYYLGADFLVFSEKNCCQLNATVAKTAVGAVDIMPIYNAPKPLKFFEKTVANKWNLVATMPKPSKNKIELSKLPELLQQAPCLLVLGSEAKGVRASLVNRASYQVALNPPHDVGDIDSLNVSVASALIMSKFFVPTAFD